MSSLILNSLNQTWTGVGWIQRLSNVDDDLNSFWKHFFVVLIGMEYLKYLNDALYTHGIQPFQIAEVMTLHHFWPYSPMLSVLSRNKKQRCKLILSPKYEYLCVLIEYFDSFSVYNDIYIDKTSLWVAPIQCIMVMELHSCKLGLKFSCDETSFSK